MTETNQTPRTRWASLFATTFMELCNGENSTHSLLDWAYELYPTRGTEDAGAVARTEFQALADAERQGLPPFHAADA